MILLNNRLPSYDHVCQLHQPFSFHFCHHSLFIFCFFQLWPNTTKGTSLCTFEKIEIFALSNRRFNKLSNDTKFEMIKLTIDNVYFLLFSLYFANYFGHYLRMNLANKMYLLLYRNTIAKGYYWSWSSLGPVLA